MSPARRIFVLLGAYEDLTERESRALRRGDIHFAITLENRKIRLAEALAVARRNAVLSATDLGALTERVRTLETREMDNLAFLREEMARVRVDLTNLKQTASRTRSIRRGYVGRKSTMSEMAGSVLGRA